MRQKMILRLFSLTALTVLLWSCRNEDLLADNTETPPSKFKVFTSAKGEKVDYAEGFKTLMEKHDSINNEQHTVKAMQNAFESSKNVSEEYIEFNIRSEDFISESGERWVVYPTVKNSAVTGLTAGILNKDETLVDFRELKPGTPYYDHALPLFSARYQKSLASAGQNSKNGKCGFPGQPPCEIDVIVITPTKPDGGGGPWIGGSGGGGGPKGCPKYSNCINPDGGGAGSGDDLGQANLNPCEKMKAQKLDLKYQEKTSFLKTKTGETFEYGFRVNTPPPGQTETQYQQMTTAVGSNSIDFKFFKTTYGYMHSHYDGLIPIFSPDDINTFIKLLIIAHHNNTPLENVFVSVVNPDGTIYQLRGDGIDVASLTVYDQTMIDNVLNRKYSIEYEMEKPNQSPEYYQKNFLRFMKDKMNINGAKLYSIDNNGKASQISLKGNSLANPIPCV